jgi:hypothetical protein
MTMAINRKLTIFLILCLLLSNPLSAQVVKHTSNVQQTWVGYFNQSRFSNKFGTWIDLHLRTKEDFVSDLSQGIARVGLTYYINDHAKLTAGYAYVHHFPSDNHKEIAQPEHRPWQQFQWHSNGSKLRIMQWIRLEERFRHKILNDEELGEGYHFNYRARYNFFIASPLSKRAFAPGTLSLVLNDEVHLNFGKEIVYNYFDQNRFFAGINYHLSKHDNIQFGYMNLFQQLTAGNQYRNIHALRLFYLQNIDWRKK